MNFSVVIKSIGAQIKAWTEQTILRIITLWKLIATFTKQQRMLKWIVCCVLKNRMWGLLTNYVFWVLETMKQTFWSLKIGNKSSCVQSVMLWVVHVKDLRTSPFWKLHLRRFFGRWTVRSNFKWFVNLMCMCTRKFHFSCSMFFV